MPLMEMKFVVRSVFKREIGGVIEAYEIYVNRRLKHTQANSSFFGWTSSGVQQFQHKFM